MPSIHFKSAFVKSALAATALLVGSGAAFGQINLTAQATTTTLPDGTTVPMWGLFWGIFFGLTDALASTLLCLIWGALIQLPLNFRCPQWCSAGDGVKITFQIIGGLAAQALVPVVLGLWIAVLGGAIMGLLRLRSK